MQIDLELEKKEILRRYRGLLRAATRSKSRSDRALIRKAFDVALEAHKDMRRKSGEPYIYHPIAVAKIVAEEIGLDTTSIVCALLHDTVEDTYITLADIENLFGKKERQIIDGLTKISGVFDHSTSAQAENFRKMLLTLSDDIRVILIKIADRLHNMRTLGAMKREKQLKIASETQFMYAPLAHRLGLYNIKTELEDLSLKHKEPEAYEEIISKLIKTQAVRTRFINRFMLPIKRELAKEGITSEIKGRTKSISSIWNKMFNKNVAFEDIYDVFAVRVIIDTSIENEKAEVWKIYSIVTDFYQPNPDRLRDWISIPKASGYESLHTTVMSPTGKWVEVQIRSRRMDDTAEKGFAAHWKYKHNEASDNNLDQWLSQIREVLESDSENALDFIDNFKLNLFAEEIYIFTPNGDLRTLPKGSTALDFAFHIHSQVGSNCIGAKVNQKLVPLSHELNSGDQVEVLTSKKQKPKEDWLQYVVTARARSRIKTALKEEWKKIAIDGKDMLRRKFNSLKVDFLSVNITEMENHFRVDSGTEMYYQIAKGKIDLKKLKRHNVSNGRITFDKQPVPTPPKKTSSKTSSKLSTVADELLLGDLKQRVEYSLSKCCNPISGDDVFGFVTVSDGIKIHRINCPNATEMMSNYAYRVMKAKWASKERVQFEVGLKFTGIDDVGLVHNITNIISEDMNVDMRAISFESIDGIFEGRVKVLVTDTIHLNVLIEALKNVEGVLTVDRMESEVI